MAPHDNERPDLVGTVLELPPGQWWSEDGWLRMEIDRVGPLSNDRPLADGWVWVIGTLRADGLPVDTCSVPVRVDALPSERFEAVAAG
jgi:hypothetical protein